MIKEALWDGMDGWDWVVIIGILRTPSVLLKHDFQILILNTYTLLRACLSKSNKIDFDKKNH